MDDKLEEMIETYKHLVETEDMLPGERVFLAKKKRDLWWEIRQEIKHFTPAIQMKVYRAANPEKVFQQFINLRNKHRELKRDVLIHYGGNSAYPVCIHCGEMRLACLSIDHIGGRGNQHRKGKLRTSNSFYNWLKSQNYPPGFQTLCMNCQFVKRFENQEEGKYAQEPIDWQN